MDPATLARSDALLERYRATDGVVLLSGVQALVRLTLDQRRADAAAGLDTAGFVTGYPGSPLAGLDLEFSRRRALLDEAHVVHRPAINEELAATAVAGSQLSMLQADHTTDGVFALWYGKAPGLDRASDAMRHGNLMGAGATGGVLVCVGDDPEAKSSSVPSSSEPTLYALAMPILSPADPQEVLDLGRHGIRLSRLSGLWVGLRVPASVADCTQSVEVGADRVRPVTPDLVVGGAPFAHTVSAQLLGATLIELERSLYGPRLEVARRYGRANALNRVTARGENDVIGVVAAGPAYLSVLRALASLGLSPSDLDGAGVRLLKVSMPYPLDEELVRDFAAGLAEIVVVEDKRAFVETFLRASLCGVEHAPAVVGKYDEDGRALVAATGEVDADALATLLATRLEGRRPGVVPRARAGREVLPLPAPLSVARGAYFCSGCPHSTSVRVPPGASVGSGSGCHGLAIQMDPRLVGTVVGRFQMGGEGAMWNGMAPFVASPHFFQNVGDGTLAHSASLAIRASVAAGVNITYKLLVNSTVAMTGGQPVPGGRPLADLARQLLAEGVSRVIVTSDDPRRSRSRRMPAGVQVWPRRRLVEAQEVLAGVAGVTVLMHDQPCAAELRRQRTRDLIVEPRERVHINTSLCEGCGDCGAVSNCLSVRPTATAFGTKTQIHQESCNVDLTCLQGRCPALVTVRRGERRHERAESLAAPPEVADPVVAERESFTLRLTGIGGTGVLTVAQVVAMAAHLEGRRVRGLDQTGIAQKGGAVVSDLRVGSRSRDTTARLGAGDCDLYLGCDLLVAATSTYLAAAAPGRTVAVGSTTMVPTGRQVADRRIAGPSREDLRARVDARTRSEANVWIDAQAESRQRLGSDRYANVLLLGAAYQSGGLPLARSSIERAIELNGVDVAANLAAFAWGRAALARADAGEAVEAGLEDVIATRVADLAGYQDERYARDYARVLERVRAADRALGHEGGALSRAAAVELHRLMAYKDEYEVARLHLAADAAREVEAAFGAGARVSYHLSPPVLGVLTRGRKVRSRVAARVAMRALAASRRLRGTRLDPFGAAALRRAERRVRDDYVASLDALCAALTPDGYAAAVELAGLPAMIRGFGEVKGASLERYERRRRELLDAELVAPGAGA